MGLDPLYPCPSLELALDRQDREVAKEGKSQMSHVTGHMSDVETASPQLSHGRLGGAEISLISCGR